MMPNSSPMLPQRTPAYAAGGKVRTPRQRRKVSKVMREFKAGTLHSGHGGPIVQDRKQAIAIALEEARRSGHHPMVRRRT